MATSLVLVVSFTIERVSVNGSGPTFLAIILGVLPIGVFYGGTVNPRGPFFVLMIVALAGYTVFWIYGTVTYSNYMLGGLDFIFIPLVGIIVMGPLVMIYWLFRIAQTFRRDGGTMDPEAGGR